MMQVEPDQMQNDDLAITRMTRCWPMFDGWMKMKPISYTMWQQLQMDQTKQDNTKIKDMI